MAKQTRKDKYPAYWHRNWYTDENGSYSVEGLNHLTQDEIQDAYKMGMGEAGPETSDSYRRIIRQLPNKTLDTNLVRVLYPETLEPIDNNSPEGRELNAAFDARKTKAGYRQEGGEIPSNDQQQLFVAIITDMAKTLGVEPSQELAEAVMAAFENNDDSQGLLTLFTKTKNKFMNETGLFREGGKMNAFVEKFKCGGKSPKKKTSKKQDGGEVELTRRQARDLSKLNKGYDNGDFRLAYQNAKNALSENSDLRGREKRMAARRMVSGVNDVSPVTPAVITGEQAQINAAPVLSPVQPLAPVRSTPPMGPVDRVQGRVNDAIDGYQRGTDRIIDGIQAGGNRVYDAVQDGVRRVNDGIQAGGNAIVDGMQNVSRRAGDWVQNAGNRVFDGIQSASNVLGVRPEFVDRAIDNVQAGVNRAYDGAQDFGARVVDGVQAGANRVYDAFQDGARRIGDGVQNVGNRVVDGGQRVRNAVIDGTQSFGNRIVDGVQAGAQRLGQGMQRAGQRLSEWFR